MRTSSTEISLVASVIQIADTAQDPPSLSAPSVMANNFLEDATVQERILSWRQALSATNVKVTYAVYAIFRRLRGAYNVKKDISWTLRDKFVSIAGIH